MYETFTETELKQSDQFFEWKKPRISYGRVQLNSVSK